LPTVYDPSDDRSRQVLFLVAVAAMAFVCNALAYWAIPPLKCEHRVYSEVWQILKDLMSGIGIVIVSDPRMVSSEHMMAAP